MLEEKFLFFVSSWYTRLYG